MICTELTGKDNRTPGRFSSRNSAGGLLFLCFYLSGEDPRFYKRRVKQYPVRLSGGFQSPTEINEINAPRGCAGIRFGRCQLTLTRIPRQFSRARIELCVSGPGSFILKNFGGSDICFTDIQRQRSTSQAAPSLLLSLLS